MLNIIRGSFAHEGGCGIFALRGSSWLLLKLQCKTSLRAVIRITRGVLVMSFQKF